MSTTDADREKAAELRAQVVEAMSWAETLDSGRIGQEGATALLDQCLAAEREAALAPMLALADRWEAFAESHCTGLARSHMLAAAADVRFAAAAPAPAGDSP